MKLLSILIAVFAISTQVYPAAPATAQALDYTFTTNSGAITITKYNGPGGDVVIPETVNGLPVTTIATLTFSFCPNPPITVTIPNSVTYIGGAAFRDCINLSGIYILGKAPILGERVFQGVDKATIYYMPIIKGWSDTFGGRPTRQLEIPMPSSAQALDYIFTRNNGAITISAYIGPGGDVAIPETISGLPITSIGTQAFLDCTSVSSVKIPVSVTSIGECAFFGCTNLSNIAISESVTNLGALAFVDCTSLPSIVIPDSVTTIGDNAFGYCTSLTNLTIPNSVISIDRNILQSCTNLTAITVNTNNLAYLSLDGVLFDKNKTALIQYPAGKTGSYTIPHGITSIEAYTFYDCTGLTSITIPDSVTSIGTNAFLNCTNLTKVYFLGDKPYLDYGVFKDCDKATVYHKPGTKGWGKSFGGRPTAQ